MDMGITSPSLIKVAFIGPDDRVNRALDIAAEFPVLSLKPWIYQDEEETLALFHKAVKDAEVIAFTGSIPYDIVVSSEKPTIPLVYVPLTGSGLMRSLFYVFVDDKIKVEALSVDYLEKRVVLETLEELGQSNLEVYAKDFKGSVESEELVKFHHDLWKAGKINVALTCLRSTYYRLLDLGVRAYRVVATNSAIRETLTQAVLYGEELRAKETQIAIQICDIDNYKELLKRSSSEYESERIRISLQNILNDYAEKTWASVHPDGNDRFTIFTTRGMLEKATDSFNSDPLLEKVQSQLSVSVSVGTGFGQTTYHAELNARKALGRAKAFGGNCSFVMTSKGRLFGPLGRDKQLEYSIIENREDLLKVARKTNLGVETITKIASLCEKLGKDTFDATEIAHGLNITPKSARRILKKLLQGNSAEIWAKEQATPTGRPRTIYRITMPSPELKNQA
jgi:hypothetical protein